MKKLVIKLDINDGKAKQKALRTVSTLSGIDSISMDMKAKTMTVIGTVDPIDVVSKLRKHWQTEIMLVGPAKEPEKKEEPKKQEPKKEEEGKKEEVKKEEEPKKEEVKKEEPKKEDGPKKEEEKKEEKKEEGEEKKKENPAVAAVPVPDPILEMVKAYKAYNPHLTAYYYVPSIEENPNACVIS